MKIAHIVPATFNYFDDIKSVAFSIIEQLHQYDVESVVTTLQYDQPSSKDREQISGSREKGLHGAAPSYGFDKMRSIGEVIDELDQYDIVHLHAPFLGAASMILQFARSKNRPPLVVTYYREVKLVDLLSFFIILYNKYYLPKILKNANKIININRNIAKGVAASRIIDIKAEKNDSSGILLDLDVANEVKLSNKGREKVSILKLVDIYKQLVN